MELYYYYGVHGSSYVVCGRDIVLVWHVLVQIYSSSYGCMQQLYPDSTIAINISTIYQYSRQPERNIMWAAYGCIGCTRQVYILVFDSGCYKYD